jgi:hypothetical protein
MWLLLAVGLARAEVVDRVVVVVHDTPILQSEVELEAVLEGIDVSPVPFWTAVGTGPADRLVDAAIIRAIAADVALYQPTREQVAERLDAVRAAFADGSAWGSFLATNGLDEARLSAILKRRMVVERYLLRTLQATPDDQPAWVAECLAHLGQLRPRVRVRVVEPGQPAPEEG